MKRNLGTISMALFVLVLLAGCTTPLTLPPGGTGTGNLQGATQELVKFNSSAEVREFLENAQKQQTASYGGSRGGVLFKSAMMETAAVASDSMAGAPAPSSAGNGGSASDYSTTNVQVQGVDEADFVKNDGKYIYDLVGDQLVIINAYPAEDAEIVSKTHIDGTPRDLFLNGDTVVIFTQTSGEVYDYAEFEPIPSPQWRSQTHVLMYDVTDREDPELLHDYTLDGDYQQSRMIGDYVYAVVQQGAYYGPRPLLPMIKEAGATIVRPDIYRFDNPEDNYVFTTVASLNVANGDVEAESFLMGYANTMYVSQEHLYIAYQKNVPYWYQEEDREARFYTVVLPLLPADVKAKINAVKNDDSLNTYERWDEISDALDTMYNTMSRDEKARMVEKIQDAVQEYELRREQERQKSVLHKINLDKGAITYVARGEVPGQLLNQFSMDEYDGNFRVATTSYLYTRMASTMYNNVYVLDEEMKTIGELEKIAKDERIYSARFLGDRLYLVTFQRIDPFFVISLENPRRPVVLGELKIPGFSDYLHPYDEDHIIGIGKETDGNEWGGVSVKGVKIALFDVSDVTKPKQVDMVEIGTSGSDSEALQDHKAFLFDKEKNLLVLPVREVKESYAYDGTRCGEWGRCYPYRQRVWQGAYVFTVTDEGFTLKGKVSHYDGDEDYAWYWGSPSAVKRSLFMDDVLYTVSQKYVKMNSLDDLEEINEVKLPYDGYNRPIYYDRPMMAE